MIAYAAIDLRGGQAVQLVGGRPDAQRVALPDPAAVAQQWIDAGFAALHVVDLDAALGSGNNRTAIAEILDIATVPVQVGGGIRHEAAIDELLAAGAARVIVGTRGIEDAAWRARVAAEYAGRIVVAADVRDRLITTRGWTEQTNVSIDTFVQAAAAEPLAALLITDVGREGRMVGIDIALFKGVATASAIPIIAAGGIRDMADLHALNEAGVAGAVLGMSLYTGAIEPIMAAAEFS